MGAIESGVTGSLRETESPMSAYQARQTLRLVARAARLGWNVPEETREEAPKLAWSLAQGADDDRTKINALRTLVAMEAQNVALAIEEDRATRPAKPAVQVNNYGDVQQIVLAATPSAPEMPACMKDAAP